MDSRNHARMVTSRPYGTLRIECDFLPPTRACLSGLLLGHEGQYGY
ncbi:hypothetical protein FHW72_004226 [Ochrobactrum sp. RC6B]|nr:hypothetical protein [Ochrobactrum sp. RH1CCR137]MBA8857998.1 hypothetical protein [Ochrobactrum sp. RH1CCR134]MBB3219105.1 hypothetical protein [Ochrobactrum sp. RC6B]